MSLETRVASTCMIVGEQHRFWICICRRCDHKPRLNLKFNLLLEIPLTPRFLLHSHSHQRHTQKSTLLSRYKLTVTQVLVPLPLWRSQHVSGHKHPGELARTVMSHFN